MATMHLMPKLSAKVPSAFVGLIIATVVEFAIVRNVGSKTNVVADISPIKGHFPVPVWFDDMYADATPKRGLESNPHAASGATTRSWCR